VMLPSSVCPQLLLGFGARYPRLPGTESACLVIAQKYGKFGGKRDKLAIYTAYRNLVLTKIKTFQVR
jgi:hypothetical protein